MFSQVVGFGMGNALSCFQWGLTSTLLASLTRSDAMSSAVFMYPRMTG